MRCRAIAHRTTICMTIGMQTSTDDMIIGLSTHQTIYHMTSAAQDDCNVGLASCRLLFQFKKEVFLSLA